MATRTIARRAAVIAATTLALGTGLAPAALAADSSSLTSSDLLDTFDMNKRPAWDPTQVIESPPGQYAHGSITGLTVTDSADGDKVIEKGDGEHYARVQATGVGFHPGERYTVRITGRTAGEGRDWGVYTWLTYKATADGKLHIDLRLYVPVNRAQSGERIIAAPVVYRAQDVRQDGRPEKADPKCVLKCERVAPVASWTDYNDPNGIVTIK